MDNNGHFRIHPVSFTDDHGAIIDQLKKDQQALRDQILSLKKRVHALENKGEVD